MGIKHLIVGQQPWDNPYGIRFSQPHAMALADIDGDGIKDIIVGKRYWAHNGHDPDERDPTRPHRRRRSAARIR